MAIAHDAAGRGPRGILLGTLAVGVLDIGEVIVFYLFRGVSPVRVVQGVASGWMGRDAFAGGAATAALGLATHFLIAFVVVSVYHLASRRIAFLVRSPFVAGPVYGLLVYALMNHVVVPLSAAGGGPKPAIVTANLLFAHVFCVGIPAALSAARGQGTVKTGSEAPA